MGEPIGSGRRFRQVEAAMAAKGARNPAALAAHAGRQKYGAKRMAQLAAAGRRRAAKLQADGQGEGKPVIVRRRRVKL